jgi:hypothetical protein
MPLPVYYAVIIGTCAIIISPLIWCLYVSIPKLLDFLRLPNIDRLNKLGAISLTLGLALYGIACTIGLPLLLVGWAVDPTWWANPLYLLAIEVPGIRSKTKVSPKGRYINAIERSILLGISTLIALSFLTRGLMGGTVAVNKVPILPTLSIPHGDYCIYWIWLSGISLSFLGSLTYRPIKKVTSLTPSI